MSIQEKILIEVEKSYDDEVSCEIILSEYYSVCYDFDNLEDFNKNILKTTIEVTANKKLTKDNLKIKHLNK
tara:strand:- start:303 stop:515 length:213 start_codon:yes stop_codon:yes gene_type:complete